MPESENRNDKLFLGSAAAQRNTLERTPLDDRKSASPPERGRSDEPLNIVLPERGLQDVFLNACRREKALVTVFLVSGIKLQGVISWFDTYCLALQRDGHVQLVYKHGISTIVPNQRVSLISEQQRTNGEASESANPASKPIESPEAPETTEPPEDQEPEEGASSPIE